MGQHKIPREKKPSVRQRRLTIQLPMADYNVVTMAHEAFCVENRADAGEHEFLIWLLNSAAAAYLEGVATKAQAHNLVQPATHVPRGIGLSRAQSER